MNSSTVATHMHALAIQDGVSGNRAMNNALWPASWGYFLSNLAGPDGSGLTPDHINWTRTHFLDHVRSSGPYGSLRCGRQHAVRQAGSVPRVRPAGQVPRLRCLERRSLRLRTG